MVEILDAYTNAFAYAGGVETGYDGGLLIHFGLRFCSSRQSLSPASGIAQNCRQPPARRSRNGILRT